MIGIDIPFYQLIKLHNLYMLLYQVKDRRGDQFLVKNILKEKHLPGTKSQSKYIGPFIADKVTDTFISHTANTNTLSKGRRKKT